MSTKEIAEAMFFASIHDMPTVYEVTPAGLIEGDPDHTSDGISVACLKATIIAIHGVPSEVVRRNRMQMLVASSKAKR